MTLACVAGVPLIITIYRAYNFDPTVQITMKSSALLLLICAAALAAAAAATSASEAYPSGYDAPSCDVELVPVRREVYDGGRIFDITHRITPDLPSFGSDDGIGQFLWLPRSMKNGSLANNSVMKMDTHTGTHVDAPGHFYDHYFDAGFDVDTLDLAVLNGILYLVSVVTFCLASEKACVVVTS